MSTTALFLAFKVRFIPLHCSLPLPYITPTDAMKQIKRCLKNRTRARNRGGKYAYAWADRRRSRDWDAMEVDGIPVCCHPHSLLADFTLTSLDLRPRKSRPEIISPSRDDGIRGLSTLGQLKRPFDPPIEVSLRIIATL